MEGCLFSSIDKDNLHLSFEAGEKKKDLTIRNKREWFLRPTYLSFFPATGIKWQPFFLDLQEYYRNHSINVFDSFLGLSYYS